MIKKGKCIAIFMDLPKALDTLDQFLDSEAQCIWFFCRFTEKKERTLRIHIDPEKKS